MEFESRGTMTRFGYYVEARVCDESDAKKIEDIIYTYKWKRVPVYPVPNGYGVPVDQQLIHYGLFTLEGAQALRWIFLAHVREKNLFNISSFQTRIVKVELKLSHEINRVGFVDSLKCSMFEYQTIENLETSNSNA